jgi:hypothetical protein
MRAYAVIGLLSALAACATPAETPVVDQTFAADYSYLSACAFERLDRKYPGHVRFTDLRGTNSARITYDDRSQSLLGSAVVSADIRPWEIAVSRAGDHTARVEIRALPTVWGPDFYAQRVLPELEACVATAAR